MKILVIGATGMLGAAVTEVLAADPAFEVTAAGRNVDLMREAKEAIPRAEWRRFDADSDLDHLGDILRGQKWIVNAAGITKPLIRDDNASERLRAIRINSEFPHLLARAAEADGARVIQIATDCVFSGARGSYAEDDPHDALDVYGKTKSLGEVPSPAVTHLRCSIIGPEPKEFKFLLEWLRRQPQSATVRGFTNHRWNGVTTLHFGKLVAGIVREAGHVPSLQHVLPDDVVTKAELLHELARCYGRTDIQIQEVEARDTLDRTLSTKNPDANAALWRLAGYERPPTIARMVEEMAAFPFRFADTMSVGTAGA